MTRQNVAGTAEGLRVLWLCFRADKGCRGTGDRERAGPAGELVT